MNLAGALLSTLTEVRAIELICILFCSRGGVDAEKHDGCQDIVSSKKILCKYQKPTDRTCLHYSARTLRHLLPIASTDSDELEVAFRLCLVAGSLKEISRKLVKFRGDIS